MEYSLIDQTDHKLLTFYGNIKPSSRQKFLEIQNEIDTSDQKKWVLDVEEFEYIDSAGLGMLIELNQRASQKGIKMSICGANDLVRKMFYHSKFDTLFEIED